MTTRRNDETVRYHLAVTSRVFAAAIVGYVLTSALTVLMALIWPLPRAQAVTASTLLSFTIYLFVILWIFSVRSLTRMWIALITVTTMVSALAWLLRTDAGI